MHLIFKILLIFFIIFSIFLFFLNNYPNLFIKFNSSKFLKYFLLPKASAFFGVYSYENNNFNAVIKYLQNFNNFYPTVDSILLEGRCFEEIGNFKRAEELYILASSFDPFYKNSSIALVQLKIKEILKNKKIYLKDLEYILKFLPLQDIEIVDKISKILINISDNLSKEEFLFLSGFIYFINPSKELLKKIGLKSIKRKDLNCQEKFLFLKYFLKCSLKEEEFEKILHSFPCPFKNEEFNELKNIEDLKYREVVKNIFWGLEKE